MNTEAAILARIRRALQRVWARRRTISWRRLFLANCGFALIFYNMDLTGSALAVILGVVMLCDAIEVDRR